MNIAAIIFPSNPFVLIRFFRKFPNFHPARAVPIAITTGNIFSKIPFTLFIHSKSFSVSGTSSQTAPLEPDPFFDFLLLFFSLFNTFSLSYPATAFCAFSALSAVSSSAPAYCFCCLTALVHVVFPMRAEMNLLTALIALVRKSINFVKYGIAVVIRGANAAANEFFRLSVDDLKSDMA